MCLCVCAFFVCVCVACAHVYVQWHQAGPVSQAEALRVRSTQTESPMWMRIGVIGEWGRMRGAGGGPGESRCGDRVFQLGWAPVRSRLGVGERRRDARELNRIKREQHKANARGALTVYVCVCVYACVCVSVAKPERRCGTNHAEMGTVDGVRRLACSCPQSCVLHPHTPCALRTHK